MIFKNFADRTGSDPKFSDQDWTRGLKNFTIRSFLT